MLMQREVLDYYWSLSGFKASAASYCCGADMLRRYRLSPATERTEMAKEMMWVEGLWYQNC